MSACGYARAKYTKAHRGLKELYEVYLREQEEGNLERATMMDRLASRALQVGARAGQCAPVLGAGLMPRAAPASK